MTTSRSNFDQLPAPLQGPLQGIVVPMATPLTLDRALDVASLERLVERLILGGVQGLFVLGTTGEGPSLGNAVRREVVLRVCRQVAGRTPVLVGVTDTALAESIDLAGFAADSGAQATVLAPPCYFPIDQEDLYRCAEQLVGNSPLPLFLYNMPALTKTWYEPATVRRLLELPAIAGVKDSSGDLDYFTKMSALVSQRPECSLLIGPEHLLGASIGLGGRGGCVAAPTFFRSCSSRCTKRPLAAIRSRSTKNWWCNWVKSIAWELTPCRR